MSLKAVDNQMYAYEYGSTPSENSFLRIQNMQAQQSEMAKQFSGGRHKYRHGRIRRGGAAGDPITIPTFPGGVSSVSPIGSNSVALQANTNLINEMNNSANDCFATNSCSTKGGRRRYLSRKNRNRSRRSRRSASRRRSIRRSNRRSRSSRKH
jgi:hypothetical protein